MAYVSNQFQNYNDIMLIGGSSMLSGLVVAVAFTVFLGVITDGFQPDPDFYKIVCPIAYGITGTFFIAGVISTAVANCKKQTLTEIEHPITHDEL
jgi:hypothetical protein